VSVYQHHAAWWLYYRELGRPVRRRIGLDRATAERVAAEVNAQLATASPTMFAFSPVCIAELQQSFLAQHEHVLRSSVATIARYRTASQHLIDFAATLKTTVKAHEISAMAFVAFLRSRAVSPNGHSNTAKRQLRDKGVQFIIEVCRSMYGFAQRQRHLPPYLTNPFAELRVDRMRIEDAKPIFVFDADLEYEFLKVTKAWEFPIQFTLAKTGMRPGELCHLLIEDLDLAGGWLFVRNKPELGWSVKTRNERAIPLLPELRSVLSRVIGDRTAGVVFRRPRFVHAATPAAIAGRQQLGELLQDRLAIQAVDHDLDRRGRLHAAQNLWRAAGAFDPDQIRNSFIRIARRCGRPQATCPKSWRHTVATLLQDANVDPLLRQITLGHKPAGAGGALGMTGVYTHSRPETQAREITRALQSWPRSLELARTWAEHGGV